MDKAEMKSKIAVLQSELATLEQAVIDFDSALERNQYKDHADAEDSITDRFRDIAHEQCEGAGNCGDEKFTQQYQIAGNPNTFQATVTFEYNRHDKTYYYIDGQDYSFIELSAVTA